MRGIPATDPKISTVENTRRIAYLVDMAASRKASPEELDELVAILHHDTTGEATRRIESLLPAMDDLPAREPHYWQSLATETVAQARQLHGSIPAASRKTAAWWRIPAAAAAAAVLLWGAFLVWKQNGPASIDTPSAQHPPASRVTLTMADGSVVELDTLSRQTIRQENATLRQEGNALEYLDPAEKRAPAGFNTLSTPNGIRFQLRLPDGSRVWLNAASSLRFPAAFGPDDRTVEVNGEAFFEVAADEQRPFRVKIGDNMQIDVLGTAFNVRAYASENMTAATLTQGRVRVSAGGQAGAVLEPGQQARIPDGGTLQIASEVNAGEITAWTNGELIFNDVTLSQAAAVLERWFGVEVELENPRLANCRFTVSFLKGEGVEQVMRVITKYNGLGYRTEGRRVVIIGNQCR